MMKKKKKKKEVIKYILSIQILVFLVNKINNIGILII
jgi:hypothetical protein